jgi:hypothetical protein
MTRIETESLQSLPGLGDGGMGFADQNEKTHG